MRRWVCPVCGQGALAPERLRQNDSRRYCLQCSAKSKFLVLRECPVVDRIRAKEAARRRERAVTKKFAKEERERLAREADALAPFQQSKKRIRDEFARLCKLKSWGRRLCPHLTMRWFRDPGFTDGVGRCYEDSKISVTLGKSSDAATVCALLLHELAHAASWCSEAHNEKFRSLFLSAAQEAYGIGTVYGDTHEDLHKAIVVAIRDEIGKKDFERLS